jgi:hypothetical protein
MRDCLPIGTIPNHVHRYTLVYGDSPGPNWLGGGNELDITKIHTTWTSRALVLRGQLACDSNRLSGPSFTCYERSWRVRAARLLQR